MYTQARWDGIFESQTTPVDMHPCLVIDLSLSFTERAPGAQRVPGTVVDAGHTVASMADTAPAHVGFGVRG